MADVEITQVTVRLERRRLPDMIQKASANGMLLTLPMVLEQARETRYSGSVVLHFHNGVPVKVESGRPAAANLVPSP